MTVREKQAIFLKALTELLVFAHLKRIDLVILDLYRTQEQQRELLRLGKTKTLRSLHLEGLAVDLAIIENGMPVLRDDKRYHILGEFWEQIGGVWGGRWESLNDIYHFEYSDKLIERYRHYVSFRID